MLLVHILDLSQFRNQRLKQIFGNGNVDTSILSFDNVSWFIFEQETVCMCNKERELYAIDVTNLAQPNPLGVSVDWWIEGVLLPIVALIGIFGRLKYL